jgi:hypothetical protein
MRRLFFVGFFFALVVAAAACASILGDYGTATVETSDEGGRDALSPDTAAPLGEGGRDAASPIDGGTDAPPLLSCAETSQGGRVQITDAGLVYEGFRVASQSGGNDAIIVAIEQGDAGMNAHAYIPSGGQTTDAQLVGLYQILDIERYSGGFAILALLNDSPSQYFGVYTIGDTNGGWNSVQQVSENNPLPNNWGNLSGALAVVDAGTGMGDGDFIVAVLDTDVPNGPQVLRAQRETGSAMQPLAVVDPNLTPHAFQMNSPAIAFDSTNAYVLLSSNGPMSSPVGDGSDATGFQRALDLWPYQLRPESCECRSWALRSQREHGSAYGVLFGRPSSRRIARVGRVATAPQHIPAPGGRCGRLHRERHRGRQRPVRALGILPHERQSPRCQTDHE